MITMPAHMLEATRLVREGRLAEATALLRDASSSPLPPFYDKPALKLSSATVVSRARSPRSARPPTADVTFEQRTYRGPSGSRSYKLFVPKAYCGSPMPLVVMLHGCTQTPDDFAAGTRMNEHAELRGFMVAYPAQPQQANASRCWNWFDAKQQRRGEGEPAIIAGIVAEISESYTADPARIFIAGLSAGGAAAQTLGMLYPDVFAGVGVHSGLTCGAAKDTSSAFAAMRTGAVTPLRAGAHNIPTIVFHGDRDTTVAPVNGDQVALQSQGARGGLTEIVDEGRAPGGRAWTRRVSFNAAGEALVEHWIVHGGGHAWFGGSRAGSYTDAQGPDASAEMVRFFLGSA